MLLVKHFASLIYKPNTSSSPCEAEFGGLVRNAERALRPEAGQGPDEADGNPVHLLRHTHGKRGAAGGQ